MTFVHDILDAKDKELAACHLVLENSANEIKKLESTCNNMGILLEELDKRFTASNKSLETKDKEIETLSLALAAAEETIVHKDNEIKNLKACCAEFRERIALLNHRHDSGV